jgi:DNA-binding GntR family transcriptional regulator
MSRVAIPKNGRVRPHRYPSLQKFLELTLQESRSLADVVGEKILSKIIRQDYPPGARLKTTQLADELGVSRTPVARALDRLSADGILLQSHNHMAEVAPCAGEWLIQIHELRQLLEPEAAFLAAGNLPEDVLDDLWLLGNDSKPNRGTDWQDAALHFDFAVHLSIAEFCGNIPMKVTIRNCWSYKRLSYELSDGCRPALRVEHDEHLAILDALAKGNSESAKSLMAKHLEAASVKRSSLRIV